MKLTGFYPTQKKAPSREESTVVQFSKVGRQIYRACEKCGAKRGERCTRLDRPWVSFKVGKYHDGR